MSKKNPKHKTRKQGSHGLPPLSNGDKFLYNLVTALIILAGIGLFVGFIILSVRIASADPSVLDFQQDLLIPAALLMFLSCVGWLCMWRTNYAARRPILPRDPAEYGRGGKYSPENGYEVPEPLFGRPSSAPAVKPTPDEEKRRLARRKLLLMTLIPLLLVPLMMFKRHAIHKDMSVTVYNMVNVESEQYRAEDITGVVFGIDYYKAGRRSRARYRTQVILKMSDGRSYTFNAKPAVLLQVKQHFPRSMVEFDMDISVEEYIERNNVGQEDALILRQVFDAP